MAFDPAFVWQLSAIPNLVWPASVIAQTNVPALTPVTNDSYLVGKRPVDSWNDKENQIAVWTSEGAWTFQLPTAGRQVWVHQAKVQLQYNGREWLPVSGLPPGGVTGTVLTKKSGDDYDADWTTVTQSSGGTSGSNVRVISNSEAISGLGPVGSIIISLGQGFGAYTERGAVYEITGEGGGWVYRGAISQEGIPEGGATGQVLVKTSSSNFAVEWANPDEVGGDITSVSAGTGLTGGGTIGDVSLAVAYGTTSTTAAVGNDSRLSNDRVATGIRTVSTIVSVGAAAAPTAGQALVANSATDAGWADVTISGDAGGDLSGSYPDPEVIALKTGSTRLSIGTIVDGEFLTRSGTTLTSTAGTSAPQPVQVNGSLVGTRDAIDIVAGTGITLLGADDSGANTVRVTITSTGGGGSGGGDMRFPYIAKPASPDAWNFEARDAASPDLATNGFTVQLQTTPYTALTRSGDVDVSSAPATNTYFSTLINGILFLQFPTAVDVTIAKATSPGYTHKYRVWNAVFGGGNNNSAWISNNLTSGTSGNTTYYIGANNGNNEEVTWIGPSSFTVHQSVGGASLLTVDQIRQIDDFGSTRSSNMLMPWSGAQLLSRDPRSTGGSVTVAYAGLWAKNSAGQMIHIDFIRRTPLLELP